MNGYLLDTNVISELRKLKPDSGLTKWVGTIPEKMLFLSSITIGELRLGVELVADAAKRDDLERWLVCELTPRFERRILPVSNEVADRWGRLEAHARLTTGKLPVMDAMIAATALYHDLSVVTRNTRDFLRSGVPVVNPWKAG